MKRIISALLCAVLLLPLPLSAKAAPVYRPEELKMEKEAILSALYEAEIADLRQAIDLGLVSCEELTTYYLKRIEEFNEPYNCFITVCDDAIEVARSRDAQLAEGTATGRLFGIPIVIKDNMNLEGYHTTNGYKKKKSQIAGSNATVVQSLLDEGAVIIAKANMSTAAQDALRSYSAAVGETKNAYNTEMAAGGSSGGSAVSVSLNFAAASLGTDTNSSLRIPAALAGCVSLRPTFGLLSNNGICRLNRTRDTAGAITRTVYDQAIMLDVLTGNRYNYSENLNGNALQGIRIGVLEELSYKTGGYRRYGKIDIEVDYAFERALDIMRDCGAEVVTVSIPNLLTLAERTMNTNNDARKQAVYAAFTKALEENNVSCLVFPSYLSAPQRSGRDANGTYWDVTTQDNINNCRILSPCAGLPEISVPIATHSRGAGIGMEIAAPKGEEQLLLDLAYSYMNAAGPRDIPTGAPDTYAGSNQGNLKELIAWQLRVEEPEPEETTEPVETTAPPAPPEEPQVANPAWWPFALLILLGVVLIPVAGVLFARVRKKREEIHVE